MKIMVHYIFFYVFLSHFLIFDKDINVFGHSQEPYITTIDLLKIHILIIRYLTNRKD